MDTVLCTAGGPTDWIFTNMDGCIESKQVEQLKMADVIKAFLVNLMQNRNEFTNDDLLTMLNPGHAEHKICFVMKGDMR
jgi:hypothetical protein